MQIEVKDFTGIMGYFEMDSNDSIKKLKTKIKKQEKIPINEQRIFHLGKELENERTFNDYEIDQRDTLEFVAKLPEKSHCSCCSCFII
ncbi:UBIQUITIN-60S ribosomal protein L40-1 [Anaeramoeba ignava]|uniref:UBIQUITIN-60S ribosomal protein L40-1 n=1 Tax=Anaeramoeba ignava TaxID=1746090 RepID=A0A9Q0RGV0_ANAIG|nr:UBIQUITIN-60S ribosomal protein L40-1 [Anaeramoeba ignava]